MGVDPTEAGRGTSKENQKWIAAGIQRVELTGPETGRANEANRSGPTAVRKSEAHGAGKQDPEAPQGGGLKRDGY